MELTIRFAFVRYSKQFLRGSMRSFWTRRRLVIPAVTFVLAVPAALAQRTSGSAGSTSPGSSASPASPSRGTVPNNSNSIPTIGNNPVNNNNTPTLNRPIFLSGKVMFDDGSQPTTDIRIERVCGGSTRLEGHTDNKGRFSFQLGQESMAFSDASDNGPDPFSNSSGQNTSPGFDRTTNSTLGGSASNPLWNCELRAAYPGFRSDVIDLSTRRSLDDPNVGTLVLHRLVNVKGSTISVTSELAPKPAQKAYQKGLQAAQKGKLDDAEKDFEQATTVYPKFAVAWFALGQVQQQQGKTDLARKSYMAAGTADTRYVSPYDRLAQITVHAGEWNDAADYSKRVIDMNPVEFPTSFWYNAIANYELHKPAEAEKSAAELLKLDTQHHFPEAENLMAQLLLNEGKYPEAAAHLRAYLALVPNAKNADALKATLLKIDQASAENKTQQPPQQ
jgi:tetratricopeptide (TPR) repeat protein